MIVAFHLLSLPPFNRQFRLGFSSPNYFYKGLNIYRVLQACKVYMHYNPLNSKLSFTRCRLHPVFNGNSISESHPEYDGHAHHYVITITSSRGPQLAGYGGLSTLPHPASYTADPRRTHCKNVRVPAWVSLVASVQ